MNLFSHNERTEWLLLAWADKHPYLFSLIEITNPTLYIVIIVAGLKVLSMGRSQWRRRP